MKSSITRLSTAAILFCISVCAYAAAPASTSIKILRFVDSSIIEILAGKERITVRRGDLLGAWTVMEIVPPRFAVLEDFRSADGHLLIINSQGIQFELSKTRESSEPVGALYLGQTREEVVSSDADLLGKRLLANPADPTYEEVSRVFPPIKKVKGDTFDFVGTPDSIEKIGFTYGGRTPNFDPAVYQPSIEAIRKEGDVWHGLVGGYLPVVRFVYPENESTWTEMLAFAPFRLANDNPRVQPVWYRVSRIEKGLLTWSRYFDSYHPFPPRTESEPWMFYADLVAFKEKWDDILKPAMRITLPDERLQNMARFSLVRAIMTRTGDFPKYGAFDKDYGGSEHDGFPDTFNVETTAMVEWGLLDRAGRYIDNYFGEFVRDDGSILYRGPEIGQYGRMLTVIAQYANAGGDVSVLSKQRRRIDAVANLLLELRRKSLQLATGDPAYGMISGWSEADSCLEKEPARYVQPYVSNSTEAERGFRELGKVWRTLGQRTGNSELGAWGQHLIDEAAALRKDMQASIARSLLVVNDERILPAIAGVKEPFYIAARREPADPQFRSYRAYMEMMFSGNLKSDQIGMIYDHRASHRDVILGMPTAYGFNSGEMAGFLSYGVGYGLIQTDRIREALLLLYSDMAHQYTRGSWMAPETRRPLLSEDAAPYATPSQLVVALMTRWLLVFEDPESETLWFGKGIPRQWFEEGKTISLTDAPTRWGRVGVLIESHLKKNSIAVRLTLPETGLGAEIKLRLRADKATLKSVLLNGKPWTHFDASSHVITLPSGRSGTVRIQARY